MDTQMVLVPLRYTTLAKLCAHRLDADEQLDAVLARVLKRSERAHTGRTVTSPRPLHNPAFRTRRYRALLLGHAVEADSLSGLLSKVFRFLADRDAAFLPRLSGYGGRTRRHVARTRDAIHPGRSDLNEQHTKEFRPGWWMGTNYSAVDVRRIIKDACQVAELSLGRDLVLEF